MTAAQPPVMERVRYAFAWTFAAIAPWFQGGRRLARAEREYGRKVDSDGCGKVPLTPEERLHNRLEVAAMKSQGLPEAKKHAPTVPWIRGTDHVSRPFRGKSFGFGRDRARGAS